MRRREFLGVLGGAVAGWPVAARAQSSDRMRRIGVLVNLASDDPESQARIGAFLQGLQEFGWAIGRNVRVEYRWAADAAGMPRYAAELVALAPDVILANANPSVWALQQVTRTLPIVFVAATEPVGSGLVESMARPGGNATVSLPPSLARARNGWSCSGRSPPVSRARRCFRIRPPEVLASSPQSRPSRGRSGWS
jgi:putative ABC transport system substrate-binding protein